MMDWDKLRIFHAVAEAGSFTHAGNTLNLSQSAVSRQISTLEASLNLKLFHRHARGLILTEQGEILFRTARELFSKVAMAEALLSEGRERPRGPLKIAVTNAFGLSWIVPSLTEFSRTYPEVEVTLILTDSDLDLSMREADVAIRIGRPVQPDLVQRLIMTIGHRIYASPDYLEQFGTPETVEDLEYHRILVYGEDRAPPTPAANWLLTVSPHLGSRQNNVVRLNNTYGIYMAAQAGLGIVSLPDYMLKKSSNLVRILPQTEGTTTEAYFVYPQELRNSMRIAVFRNFLLRKISEAGEGP